MTYHHNAWTTYPAIKTYFDHFMGKRACIIKDLQIYKSMADRLCKISKI